VVWSATALTGILCVATAIWPQWIEALTGADPDGGDGSAELWVARVVALAALAALAGMITFAVVRRWRSAAGPSVAPVNPDA
jgi:hypothetical protein